MLRLTSLKSGLAGSLVIACCWATVACGEDGQNESEAKCPSLADSCPDGCFEVHGQPVVQDCLGPNEVLGCSATSAGFPAQGCIKSTNDGVLYLLPTTGLEANMLSSSDWEGCSQEEAAAVTGKPLC